MIENINLLRLACLIQDRDNQDFKRVILSIIFELLYENNNSDLFADELFNATTTKCKEPIDRDFFDSLIANSVSFVVTNTDNEPLIRLTSKKINEVENSISEFSIEPSIEKFINNVGHDERMKDVIIKILYQSIYENIYAFNPSNIHSLVPDVIKENFTQLELDLFNKFLEYDDPQKNRRLYNQFVKAIEFAILTSGKGVKQFSDKLYTDKTYILDTNIIFRMLGVGGDERKDAILKLISFCIKQGVKFEYTITTYNELNNTLDASISKIIYAEQSRKVEIIQELVSEAPHFFNDDFIVQYSKLKNLKIISSPEQYGLEMKAKFKKLNEAYGLEIANHNIKIETHEINLFAKKLISERKKITSYRYSQKQASVDAYNVLYVRKRRGGNDFNYSEVKSFYLTTDRGLNKILSDDEKIIIPATILPSQLFAIHNPLSDDKEDVDYDNFFSFIKRRTSEFKHRGRDVFSFIQQSQMYSTDREEIKNLILTFTDERFNYTKTDELKENILVKFKDFAKTYFDNRLNEIEEIEDKYGKIKLKAKNEKDILLKKSKGKVKVIDVSLTILIIPLISICLGLITNWKVSVFSLLILEGIKFWLSKKENYYKELWVWFYVISMKKTAYYKLTSSMEFIDEGLEEISQLGGNIWK